MTIRTPQVADIAGKKVLVRVDYNVPLEPEDGSTGNKLTVADDRRIQASLPLIDFLRQNQARVILMSHLGRPTEANEAKFSLQPVAEHLKKLGVPVTFVPDCVGPEVQAAVDHLNPGDVLLLENLRYHPEEKKNDPEFARHLASVADVYINEAFSASHRAHASTEGVTHFLPSFAGLSLAQEVGNLHQLISEPRRPFVIVVGGAKIADKVGALVNLTRIADLVLVGGGIANTFMKADGLEIHKSYIQDAPADLKQKGIDYIHVAHDLLEETKTEKIITHGFIPLPKILYPIDVVAAPTMEATAADLKVIELTHNMKDTPNDEELMYLDIGPKTIQLYKELISHAGTVFWNGPMGVFEKPLFEAGTREVAQAIATATHMTPGTQPPGEEPGFTVIGGGDTLSAAKHFHLEQAFSYISTAGGASLEFLSGKELPGLKPLI